MGGSWDQVNGSCFFLPILPFTLVNGVKRTSSLLASTIGTSLLSNLCLGEAYLSIILGGQLYKDAYKSQGLHPAMLSRSLEQGATLSAGLIPWTTAGLFYIAGLMSSVEQQLYVQWRRGRSLASLKNETLAHYQIPARYFNLNSAVGCEFFEKFQRAQQGAACSQWP